MAEVGLAASGKQVKDTLARSAVLCNGRALGWDDNERLAEVFAPVHALHGRYFVVRLGKKKYHLFYSESQ